MSVHVHRYGADHHGDLEHRAIVIGVHARPGKTIAAHAPPLARSLQSSKRSESVVADAVLGVTTIEW